MILDRLAATISRYVETAETVDTSIPAIVRALGLKADPGENVRGFSIRVGHALLKLGFRRYRAMLQGERAYRYARRQGATPRAHDPQLHPAEVAPAGGFIRGDFYESGFGPRTRRASTRKTPRNPAPAREHVALYVAASELAEWKAAAAAERVSLSAYLSTIIRFARPHCPPGAVAAAVEKDSKNRIDGK